MSGGEDADGGSSLCFLELEVQGRFLGWLTFELFDRRCPLASANFKALCVGNLGVGKSGRRLHYKGTRLFRIVSKTFVQGGDIVNDDGTGGESIFGGPFFNDEMSEMSETSETSPTSPTSPTSVLKHDRAGLLCTANLGVPNTNSSQFYVTLCPARWLDGRDTIFGRLVGGHQCLAALEQFGTGIGDVTQTVTVSNCGTLTSKGLKKKRMKSASRISTSNDHTRTNSAPAKSKLW